MRIAMTRLLLWSLLGGLAVTFSNISEILFTIISNGIYGRIYSRLLLNCDSRN